MKKIEKEIDKIENLIWAWAKETTDTWKRNPTASSPFYGINAVRKAIRNLVETGKIESKDIDFTNWLKKGEKLKVSANKDEEK